jgi:hypothetical protein
MAGVQQVGADMDDDDGYGDEMDSIDDEDERKLMEELESMQKK